MLQRCIDSYRDAVDEVIVVEDGGVHPFVPKGCTYYVYREKNRGFTATVNEGWRLSTGDFTIIANSDTSHVIGDLRLLCISGKVTSPVLENDVSAGYASLAGALFCVPKEVAAQRGMLDESMRQYFSDTDYAKRTLDIYQRVPIVVVYHEKSATTQKAPPFVFTNKQDMEAFGAKWRGL